MSLLECKSLSSHDKQITSYDGLDEARSKKFYDQCKDTILQVINIAHVIQALISKSLQST